MMVQFSMIVKALYWSGMPGLGTQKCLRPSLRTLLSQGVPPGTLVRKSVPAVKFSQ
jgi:hypothetical protein